MGGYDAPGEQAPGTPETNTFFGVPGLDDIELELPTADFEVLLEIDTVDLTRLVL